MIPDPLIFPNVCLWTGGIGGTVRVKDGEFRLGVGFDVGQENRLLRAGSVMEKSSIKILGQSEAAIIWLKTFET